MPPLNQLVHEIVDGGEASMYHRQWRYGEEEDVKENTALHDATTPATVPLQEQEDDEEEDFGFAIMGPPPSALHKQTSSPSGQHYHLHHPPSPRPRGSVHFGCDDNKTTTANQVWLIPHWKEYAEDELVARWYTATDYQGFRQDVTDTLYLLSCAPQLIDGLDYTARGVEGRTRDIMKHRHHIKNEARSAVLEEQSYQQAMQEEPNDELIAAVYHQASRDAVQDALQYAHLDVLDVQLFQQQDAQKQQEEQYLLDDFDDSWISSVASECEPCSHYPQQPLEQLQLQSYFSRDAFVEPQTTTSLQTSDSIAAIFDNSWLTEGTSYTTSIAA